MCGLIFCADPLKWESIVSANLARAGRNKGAFTVTEVLSNTPNGTVVTGPTVEVKGPTFCLKPVIAHMQAPTSSDSRPHPAVAGPVRVWHNGLVKTDGIMVLQEELFSFERWDTMLIAQALEAGLGSEAFQLLGIIQGSLAVIAIDNATGQNTIYAFRNAIAPLYTDGKSLSSVPVDKIDRLIDAGVVYTLAAGEWVKTRHTFPCTHNPFGV